MATAKVLQVDTEDPSQQGEPDSGEISPSCPTCPRKPQVSDCPYEKDSPEWRNWYKHFGRELVRWSQSLTETLKQMGDDCSSIQWGALGLHDVETIKETVHVTRVKETPVVTTEDDGVTLAVDCDIVTYGGTGVLINTGNGVVMNIGSGIVINYSTGTCTNTSDGTLICFGKCTLVNSGTGFGIIDSCKVLHPEERISLNDAGGILIKGFGHGYKKLNVSRWSGNSNDDSSDGSHSFQNGDSFWSDIETELSEMETESDSLYESDSSCSEDDSAAEFHLHLVSTTDGSSAKETTSADETDASDIPDSDDREGSIDSASNNASESDGESEGVEQPGPTGTITSNETFETAELLKSISEAETVSDRSLLSDTVTTNNNNDESIDLIETDSGEVTLARHADSVSDTGGNVIDSTAPTARE